MLFCFEIIRSNNNANDEAALSLLHTQTLYERRKELTIGFAIRYVTSDDPRDILLPSLHSIHGRDEQTSKTLLQRVRCKPSRYKRYNIHD